MKIQVQISWVGHCFNHGCQIKQVSDHYDHPMILTSSLSTLRSATWWTSWFLGSATTGQIPCGRDCNCWGKSRSRYILKYLRTYENIQIFENISPIIKETGMRASKWSACVESSTSYQLSGDDYEFYVDNWDSMQMQVMVLNMMMAWMIRTSKNWPHFRSPRHWPSVAKKISWIKEGQQDTHRFSRYQTSS